MEQLVPDLSELRQTLLHWLLLTTVIASSLILLYAILLYTQCIQNNILHYLGLVGIAGFINFGLLDTTN